MATNRRRTARDDRPVAIAVSDLHVTYRAYSTGRRVPKGKLVVPGKRGIREIRALKGVSFRVHEGERIGVIGRNGAGKSTLMRAIAGVVPAARGGVFGSARPVLLGINAALIPDISGEKNIRLGCLAMGMSPDEADEKFDSIVEFSGLGDFIDMPMSTYSSGMAARLRFAIAVARDHEVLLIDEALAVGDREFKRRSAERLRQMSTAASTVFLVSHSLATIRRDCERAVWLDQGRVREAGPVDWVCNAYESEVAK